MKKDKKDKFLYAMGDTDEGNIVEYQEAKDSRKKLTVAIIAATVALCLIVTAVAVAPPCPKRRG